MGDMADQLTEDMLDGKALHDAGKCEMGCDWCRFESECEQDAVEEMGDDFLFYEETTGKQIGNK